MAQLFLMFLYVGPWTTEFTVYLIINTLKYPSNIAKLCNVLFSKRKIKQNNPKFYYCHLQQVRSSRQIRAMKILNLIPKHKSKSSEQWRDRSMAILEDRQWDTGYIIDFMFDLYISVMVAQRIWIVKISVIWVAKCTTSRYIRVEGQNLIKFIHKIHNIFSGNILDTFREQVP